jgi:hypothetical protein
MRIRTITAAAVAAAAMGSCASTDAAVVPGGYSANVDNPWYPLRPGTVMRYRGEKDGRKTTDVVTVTGRTKVISGVPCAVVRDRLFTRGRVVEDTTDWFSQDRAGTVWYFGEQTRELDLHGRTISTEGSWETGVKGALPGVIMPAHPRVGYAAAQEHFPGQAEDHFKVVSLSASRTVPYRAFRRHVMLTREWTPLEPGVIDHKYYVRGIGEVEERTARGPREFGTLVSISRR